MPRTDLTPDPQADADALRDRLTAAVAADLAGLAERLATKTDRDLFGATAFRVRDAALAIAAKALRAAAEAVALAGAMGSFAEAAGRTLPKLCGLRVSESTVERATERAGAAVGERLAAGRVFGPPRPWEWTRDADGKTCGYVSADLTGVGMQGPDGARADGRMAAVGMVWNAGEGGRVRYVCGLAGGLAALGEPLRRQAAQVGMDRADRWVAISDGGSGIEDRLRSHFPRSRPSSSTFTTPPST